MKRKSKAKLAIGPQGARVADFTTEIRTPMLPAHDMNGVTVAMAVFPPLMKLYSPLLKVEHVEALCINGRWFEPSHAPTLMELKWESI